jgi:hypothetical protein
MLVWVVLDGTGIFDSLNKLLREILAKPDFSVTTSFSLGQVGLFAVVVAIINTVVGTALGAITAMLYNFSVRITGGLLVGFTNN